MRKSTAVTIASNDELALLRQDAQAARDYASEALASACLSTGYPQDDRNARHTDTHPCPCACEVGGSGDGV